VNRNRLPSWINRLIDLIADAPMSPLGRLAARRLGRPAPRGSVPTTSFAEKPARLLIAPVNYSGQAFAWARALEAADTGISARNMAFDVPGGFDFEADLLVPVGTYHNDPDWQRRQFEAATRGTHVLIEAEEPPFGRLMGRSVEVQAQALIDHSVDVAYLAHGTDARLPSRHMREHPLSYYDDPAVYVPRAEQLAARNIALLERSGRPVFVSTPDLRSDLPDAFWCPVVVDPQRWAADAREERPAGAPLRVAHAPSVAAYKGTPLIMPMLEQLQAEGLIELDLIQGVPSTEMPARFAEADVVLDQFRERVRADILAATGLQLPVIEASVGTLEVVLRRLIAAPDLSRERARSVEFVSAVHDGRYSARVLQQHWVSRSARKEGFDASGS
jgi:hypothetical protein